MRQIKVLSIPFFVAALVIVNATVQYHLQQDGLNDEIVNAYSPTSSDAVDYFGRAQVLVDRGSFAEAFADGYRLPGYPLFLSVFYLLFEQPRLAARYAQLLLSAAIVFFFYLTLLAVSGSKKVALFGALICALWFPIYYFSPILTAESCSLFLASLLCWLVSKIETCMKRELIWSAVIIAIMTYCKPNLALFCVPTFFFYGYRCREKGLRLIVSRALLFGVLYVSFILPWSMYVSLNTGRVVFLSTTQGINLYLGAGLGSDAQDPTAKGALCQRAATRLGLYDRALDSRVRSVVEGLNPHEGSDYLQKTAVAAWKSRPLKTSLYGLTKILHSFGFSFRHLRDTFLAGYFIVSVISSVYLWRRQRYREWCVFFWAVLLSVSALAFVFLPNQRFKTVMFDLPALLVSVLAFWELCSRAVEALMKNRTAMAATAMTYGS